MSFNAQILADSLSPQGDRITTMKITFPRMVLAEFNTHRMFSRNSASSRAIPFKKMVQMVEENPFVPIAWQKEHSGMQGTEYWTGKPAEKLNSSWIWASKVAIANAKEVSANGATKQLCNRLLEPFMWHTVIVTATEWENFFKLRCPQYTFNGIDLKGVFRSKKDALNAKNSNIGKELLEEYSLINWFTINKSQAEIHIQAIAELMWDAYNESTPKKLQVGEWHIPFGDKIDENLPENFQWNISEKDYEIFGIETQDTWYDLDVKIATARCARISYETLGDNPKIDYEADIKLHDRLLAEEHMSPFEHCAKVPESNQETYEELVGWEKGITHKDIDDYFWSGNFKGFIQYRQLVK